MDDILDALAKNIIEHIVRTPEMTDEQHATLVKSILVATLAAEGFVRLQPIVTP